MRTRLGWPAVLVAVCILRMGWVLMGSQTMLWTEDQVGLWNTLYINVRDAFLQHRMPYWNAWSYSGLPLQENLQAAPFYVLHYLFYPFPWATAQELILTLHEVMAALFAWAWARKVGLSGAAAFTVGGVFAWSGVMTRQTTVLPHMETMVWLPFCLWMWEEARTRPVCYAAVVLGFVMMLLAGSVQVPLIVAIGWLGLVVLPSYRTFLRTALLSLACAGLAAAMTAFFWWPAARLLSHNVRTLMPIEGFAGSEAFDLAAIPHLLFPVPGGETMWTLGITGTLLALCSLLLESRAVPAIRYWIVSVTALLLGMGTQGKLLPLVCWIFPPAALIRTSGRFTVLMALAMAMLAGLGVAALARRKPGLELLAVGLMVLEMGCINRPVLQPREAIDVPAPLQALAGDGQYRFGMVFPQETVHYLNWGTFIHRSNIAGFDAACTWPYLEALWYVDHTDPVPMGWFQQLGYHDNMVNLHHWDSPIIRLLNARYGLIFLRSTALAWTSVPSPLPRYWVVHTTHIEPDHHRLYTALLDSDFHPQREAWLYSGAALRGAGRYGDVEVLQEDGGDIRLQVKTDAAGLLVASQIGYAGWHATVDQAPIDIQTVDGVLMGIPIPAGTHTVTFRYVPDTRLSTSVSIVAWGLFLVVSGWLLRVSRTAGPPYGAFRYIWLSGS